MGSDRYGNTVQEAELALLEFLRAFESVQNNMRPEQLAGSQEQLREAAPEEFPPLVRGMREAEVPEAMRQFHDAFTAGLRHCSNAREAFLGASESNYPRTGMDIRRSLSRGLHLLYGVRRQTPQLSEYWFMPEAKAQQEALETPSPDTDAAVGVMHRRRTAPLADYSLYVPENYSPSRKWPLIICLHGAGGCGDQFIWSWLRPAKSRGYMLLAPKSQDVTWSILQPGRDIRSVESMLEEVSGEYAVDRDRVYLSGLSDGGTYTYLLGLARHELFAGIAPVAGDLHGMADDMLLRKQGRELPIYIVHGAHDHIFSVESAREGHAILTRLGYNARYEELPDWGHSYCSEVNEQLVMPWFESPPNSFRQ